MSALALALSLGAPAPADAQDQSDDPLADILGPDSLNETEVEAEKPDLSPAPAAEAEDPDGGEEEAAAPAPRKRSGPIAALDEIKVTAQKKEEDVQDVPISVTAIGRDTLEFKGLSDVNNIALFTPNVNLLSTPTFTFVYMRGVGSGFNKGFEQSVATIIDGVFYSRPNYLNDVLLDIDAVEALRGPQGTLQGKNSTAGALSFRTGNPEPEFYASADAQASTEEAYEFKGYVTGPVFTDKVRVRLAASYLDQKGDVYNTTLDRYENDALKWALRGKIAVDITEDIEAQIGVTYSSLEQNGTGAQISVWTEDIEFLYKLFDPEADADRFNFQNSQNTPGYVRRDTITLDANLTWEFDDGGFLAYVGGYSTFEDDVLFDADFGPAPILDQDTLEDYKQLSHELRYHSKPGDIEYVAGLYFFQSQFDFDSSNHLLDVGNLVNVAAPVLLNNLLGIGPVLDGLLGGLLGQQGLIGGLLGTITPVTNLLSLEGEDLTYQYYQKSTSYAAFGQATWYFDSRWTFIAGLRLTYEKKEASKFQQISGLGVLWPLLASPEIVEFNVPDIDRTEFNFTPKVSVKYSIAEDISMFFTYAEGFKAGGYNPQAANAGEFEYDPESSRTYELGLRSKFFNGLATFNITGFWTNFKDIQVVNFAGSRFVVENAEEARSRGVELEFFSPVSENLILTGTFGFTDAHYLKFTDAPCKAPEAKQGQKCDLSGKEIGDAIPLNASVSAISDWPLFGGKFNLFIAVDALYQGGTFNVIDLDPLDFRPGYWGFGSHVGFRDPDDVWFIAVHGFNLTDKDIQVGSADLPLFPNSHFSGQAPGRFFALQARVKF